MVFEIERKNNMTLLELQYKLGEQIEILTDSNKSYKEKKLYIEAAMVVSSLAKQMINNADVILRTEKLVNEGKMRESSLIKMISSEKNEQVI